MKLDKKRVIRIIKAAIMEDIAGGDITTNTLISKTSSSRGCVIVKENCVVCGLDIAEWVVNELDCSIRFKPMCNDGEKVPKNKEILFLDGHSRGMLAAERVMLNFLSFLSSISTNVNKYVEIAASYNVKILDTRKTLPLLRYLEKYAVVIGGGQNHRMNLQEMVMIKDNHFRIVSNSNALITQKSSRGALGINIQHIKNKLQKNMQIEVEVEDIETLKKYLSEKPDIIMLDNMSVKQVKEAIEIRKQMKLEKHVSFEVSGGINIENIEAYAKTGVDAISIGNLTNSVNGVDFSLEIVG